MSNKKLTLIGKQINPTVGDLEGNTFKILDSIRSRPVSIHNKTIIVFPELSITGYPPLDLVLRSGFVEMQLACLKRVVDETAGDPNLYVVLGVVTRTADGSGLHNSLMVISNGEVILTYHKQLLPTYNIFDEKRLFTPGSSEQKPVLTIGGLKLAFFICEDLWSHEGLTTYGGRDLIKELQPGPFSYDRKIDVVVSINASPAEVDKIQTRNRLFSSLSERNKVFVFYVNQVGGNDDLVFDGCSFMLNHGRNKIENHGVCVGKQFKEDTIAATIYNSGRIQTTWEVTSNPLPTINMDTLLGPTQKTLNGVLCRPMYITELLLLGIRDYVNKCGFKGVTVSLSGGIDSALVTTLAVLALGKDRVECTTMPSRYSSLGSVSDSEELCLKLGIPLHTIEIEPIVNAHEKAYASAMGEPMSSLARENLQAAVRGNLIMRRSNSNGRLVLIGSNKSEGSVGYFTMFGDSNGGLAPIGDLYKTEVYELASFINENSSSYGYDCENLIPASILFKEPSAELAEGQLDSNSLPPYPVLDAILKIFIEGDLLPRHELHALKETLKNTPAVEIKRIISLVDKTEYKRRMLAPILRVNRRSFGSGRVIPIAKSLDTFFDLFSFR